MIKNNFKPKFSIVKIILASKSPRRSQLLSDMGYSFIVRSKDTDESYPADMPAHAVAEFLARKKAVDCAEFVENADQVLITADTTVILNHKIYGKPESYEDAVRILADLSGTMHEVVTGVTLYTLDQINSFSETSKVYIAPLSQKEIETYIQNFRPYDKAGAYAIQEWIGLAKITKIEGTYSNIMGLPTAHLYEVLESLKINH